MLKRCLAMLAALSVLSLAACSDSDDGEGGDSAAADEVTCDYSSDGQEPARQVEPPPSEPEVSGKVEVTIKTNIGDLNATLDADDAPCTVNSFVSLAKQDYYDDTPCPRLANGPGFALLQCGDPTGTGRGNPGYGYGIENAPDDGLYPPGTLAMARTQDPNSNGGQFFIVYDDTRLPVDGGGYSVFGQVTDGLEIVEAIAAQGGQGGAPDGQPAQPISILSVDVEG